MDRELFNKVRKSLAFEFPIEYEEWEKSKGGVRNYHKHTSFSNFVTPDSATLVPDFLKKLDEMDSPYYFSGEHGFQGEWLYCYSLCSKTEKEDQREKMELSQPIKFRYSVEAYWVKDINAEIEEEYEEKKTGEKKVRVGKDRKNCHMVLVARNYKGVRRLNHILSVAAVDGFYYRPRIDLNLLFTLDPEDVYITSACLAGWTYEDATEIWLRIAKHFKGSFFLEVQPHPVKEQIELNQRIAEMARTFKLPLICGLDTHWLDDKDKIRRDKILERKNVVFTGEHWELDYPDKETIMSRFHEQGVLTDEEILSAMLNTYVFDKGCEEITIDTSFKIPIYKKYQNLTYEERAEKLHDFLMKQYAKEPKELQDDIHLKHLEYEFGEIVKSGTVDYFILNANLVHLAQKKYGGQLTTTSRGSAASYYVSKLCGFTTIDEATSEVPLFEDRFITATRILQNHQLPDIDMNISAQEPFVKASRELVGEKGCYPLLAVGTLKEKSGFRLYADTEGIEPSKVGEIAKAIDSYNEDVKNADDDSDKKDIKIESYIKDPELLRIFNESKAYQSIVEQAKVHACGFAVFNGNPNQPDVEGYGELDWEIGLIRCVAKSGNTNIVLNIEGNLLDEMGLVKNDYLIVDVVGLINKLYSRIFGRVPTVNELREMVNNDAPTWDLYKKGITCCLNQCEKAGATKKIMTYKPRNVKELACFVAGIRPGFKSLIDGFIGRAKYTNGEPAIDELLESSYHYMIFQESVMKIFNYLGIPMAESYDTIKKISKKKLKGEALAHVEATLKEHWLANIGNLDNFEKVYTIIKDSSRYSFNSSHALAMAFDSLYEAWAKAHHTSIFYEVTLNHYRDKGNKDKVADLIKEAVTAFGYKIGEYGFGRDNASYVVDDETKTIYPCLEVIKGIGKNVTEGLNQIARKHPKSFLDMYLMTQGMKINSSVMQKLIMIGFFGTFGTVKKNLETLKIIQEWEVSNFHWKSVAKKDKLKELGISDEDIRPYASDETKSGISKTQYKFTDAKGFVEHLISKIPNDEFPSYVLASYELCIAGSTQRVDSELAKENEGWRTVLIQDVNTLHAPKIKVYCLANGKEQTFKMRKTRSRKDYDLRVIYSELPVKKGDVIYISQCRRKPKMEHTKAGFTPSPTDSEWWIEDASMLYESEIIEKEK